MKISINKRIFLAGTLLVLIGSLLFAIPSFSEEAKSASAADTIQKYREILKSATGDSARMADAHYKIGFALEKMGRNTEATAEYLKVIINYPNLAEINQKAQKRLSVLYSDFSEKSKELFTGREKVAGEKDPRIFFAYIKSLYENYRNMGQYDKAIDLLKKLYDMDPGNQEYLIDMGEIYLDGYNDADGAIRHFKKAIEVNADNPRSYVELGRAYEKKGDYENAINSYAGAARISPANPWAIYGIRRTEGIRLALDRRLVKDWYFLGPFDNSDREGLERASPPEQKIALNLRYGGKDRKAIRWFRPFGYDASGYVDLNVLIAPNDYAVAYALTYAYSPKKRDAKFLFGFEDSAKIWLNGELVFDSPAAKSAEVDNSAITVHLKKGWNGILIKVSDTWGKWGFYFRATDLNGNPMEDLIFDPLRDNERLKRVQKKLSLEKSFRFTRIASIYTVALSILLLGLYFMISNMRYRIKINRMKEDFISNVSHELKTPIAAVKMLTETLKRGKVKKEARRDEYYDMIIREADRLTRFIGKILDFSRIEKGGKVFYFEKTSITELAKAASDLYRDEAQDKELMIKFNAKEKDVFAEIDKDAIFQVIFNLMDNAYKYSKKKKDIKVNVWELGGNARVEVIDKGSGISKECIEKIFDKFYRSECNMKEGIKGSGLGLSFVKSVIDAHSGKIAVESEIGKGSKFIILLPAERT